MANVRRGLDCSERQSECCLARRADREGLSLQEMDKLYLSGVGIVVRWEGH